MDDRSDIAKKLFEALPAADEPDGWQSAPIVDGWSLTVSGNEGEVAVAGYVSGSEKFENGHLIRTSALKAADAKGRFVVTQNSTYKLGWPQYSTGHPDSACIWPAALHVASAADWRKAALDALTIAGPHTVDAVTFQNFVDTMEEGDWAERWREARKLGGLFLHVGRRSVAEAFLVLATDPTKSAERIAANSYVRAGFTVAAGTYGRDLTIEEKVASAGWAVMAELSDVAFPHRRKQLGLGDDDDPVKVANTFGRRALLAASAKNMEPAFRPDEDPGIEPDETAPDAHGVVVLKEIGGIDTSSGREARRALKAIEGVKLPLTPVPDLAAVRRALAAEFPYATAQIDVVLADLVGRQHVKIKSTIFSGPPGNGKSRLCHKLGALLGLHVTRNDCAADDDNTFAGTPRRWSSGEPSVPLRAMMAAKKADGLIVLDEIDKTGTSRNHGRLVDVLLSFLEQETAQRFSDVFVQATVNCSFLSFVATANKPEVLDSPLRDRFRLLVIPQPTVADLPILARSVVKDLAAESGLAQEWFPNLDNEEMWLCEQLWKGGSVRRLREIIARIVAKRADMPRH